MQTSSEQTANIQSKIIKELEASPDKIRYRPWTPFEDGVLREYYGRKDSRLIAKLINRTPSGISCRASSIGITGKVK